MVIDYPHVRKHEHKIDLSGINWDLFKDVPDDIELQPITVNNTLDD